MSENPYIYGRVVKFIDLQYIFGKLEGRRPLGRHRRRWVIILK
jgi:hypothetical protein